jgi:hypothetical protein
MLKNLTHQNNFSLPLYSTGISALTLGVLIPGVLLAFPVIATQLSDGRTVFDRAPRLVRAANDVQATDTAATYQFTLYVPEDAGASLQAVRIMQVRNPATVNFEVSRSRAFLGDSFAGGPIVPLANVGGNLPENREEVTIVFNQPIAPGQTVTVSLETSRNPSRGGTYLFGITALPVGENSPGLFLGHGRVQLYENER